MSFERMVATIQSKKTLQCTERLLRRLSEKLALRCSDVMSDVSGLMRRLYPKAYQQADRYTPRVFLCAYMILSHPEVRCSPLLTVSKHLTKTRNLVMTHSQHFQLMAWSVLPSE